jgi:hypothetical protein
VKEAEIGIAMAEARLWGPEPGKGFYWEQNERREQNEGEVKNRWQGLFVVVTTQSENGAPKKVRFNIFITLLTYNNLCRKSLNLSHLEVSVT